MSGKQVTIQGSQEEVDSDAADGPKRSDMMKRLRRLSIRSINPFQKTKKEEQQKTRARSNSNVIDTRELEDEVREMISTRCSDASL